MEFCYKVGMNYVSCSPYLILGARLAAAQARIRDRLAGGTDHPRPPGLSPSRRASPRSRDRMTVRFGSSVPNRGVVIGAGNPKDLVAMARPPTPRRLSTSPSPATI